jgi:hypothetical protein
MNKGEIQELAAFAGLKAALGHGTSVAQFTYLVKYKGFIQDLALCNVIQLQEHSWMQKHFPASM